MQTIKGTEEELQKIALEVDRLVGVDDMEQLDVGGGIHGDPPKLTCGEPVLMAGNVVYCVHDAATDDNTIEDAVKSAVITEGATVTWAEVDAATPVVELQKSKVVAGKVVAAEPLPK